MCFVILYVMLKRLSSAKNFKGGGGIAALERGEYTHTTETAIIDRKHTQVKTC